MNQTRVLDGAAAIWGQDAAALEDALDRGWGLPTARLRSGHTEDSTLILRVIASGWAEGWRIWSRKRPDFATDPILIESILSQAQADILGEVIRQNGNHLPWAREKGDLRPPHLMFQLIGSQMGQMGKLVPDEQIAATARWLATAGIDPQEPYPGEHCPSDLTAPGHTLWTWCVLWGYFDLAQSLGLGEEVFGMPKANQSLSHWFERAWVPSWATPRVNFDGGRARITWLQWMTTARFQAWIQQDDRLRDIELHEVLCSLPEQYQALAWGQWLRREGEEWSPLHDLVSSVLPREAVEVALEQMKKSLPPEQWEAGWLGQDAYGISPQLMWEAKLAAQA